MKPFLYLPFKKQKYRVSEGWYYSQEEHAIHGYTGHAAIDFDLPRGTEVLATADGWAVSSYMWLEVKNEDGSKRKLDGKVVSNSYGYFVQIYHPESGLYTVYAHLEKVGPKIKFRNPTKRGEKLWPVGHKVKPEKLPNYPFAVWVKRGDVIGFVGDSGLTLGYQDFPNRPDPEKFPSWDTTHIHFEVFERVGSKGKKKHHEPYGIKGHSPDEYPDSFKKGQPLGQKSEVLWVLGEDGLPQNVVSRP
jgi:murein DD-endopeptidase MepM/ murein hydrolase activator NlpD